MTFSLGLPLLALVIACGKTHEVDVAESPAPAQSTASAGRLDGITSAPSLDGQEASENVIYPPQDVTERLPSVEAFRFRPETMEQMLAGHSIVIVGRVVGVEVGYPMSDAIAADFGRVAGSSPPADNPKSEIIFNLDPSDRIGPVGSWYKVEVLEAIDGAVSPGDVITVNQ